MKVVKLHKSAATAGAGELVLQNGRQAGARRPLVEPTTFVGRSQGCDILLNIDGVDPLHCLLVFGPDGVQLRDLNSVHGTYVNGVRTERILLQHGDVLKVGPFQFRLELPPAASKNGPGDTSAQDLRESVGVQAAAIAAQQIALEEEEARLQKRKGNLQQQEEQLAAHLAEKQRQVQLWSEYTKAERETLRKEKLEHEKKMAKIEGELLHTQQELAQDHEKLTLERQHINRVYQRLRQRWQRQWSAEKEKYRKQADQLQAESTILEQNQNTLREREAALAQNSLAFNTNRELNVRQLQDGRNTLQKDQESWRKRRSLELTALNARRRELAETQIKITQARQLLLEDKDAWDRRQEALQKELHGLNNRIVHQRMRLQEQEEQLVRIDALRRDRQQSESPASAANDAATEPAPIKWEVEILSHDAAAVPADNWQLRCAGLDRLASELDDHRALLVEQYKRLAEIQEAWQEERDRAAAELEALAQRLLADEQVLTDRQQQTTVVEELLRERQAEIDAVRQEVLVWRAQLKTREQTFEQEYDKEMLALRQKETLLQEHLAGLTQLRQRWNYRRQQEIEQLQTDRTLLARAQNEAHAERVLLFQKNQQLAEEKRILAEKALALEQYRQEVFLRSKDPAAQRRVERLRRRWLALNAALIANAKSERKSTKKEMASLEACRTQLMEQLISLTQNERALAETQSLLNEREAVLTTRQMYIEQELRNLESQRQQPEKENLRRKDEVETMAKAVYEEDDAPPIDQAA